MDSKQLEVFLAAARLLNFGEAARELSYSQSTISEQIRSLEEYLGAKLFERIGRRVFLTEQGRALIPRAERMVRDGRELQQLFRSPVCVSGALVIGAAETLCAYYLPPVLKEYRRLHPQVKLRVKVGNCIEFPQWLQQNSVDVAFGMHDESRHPQLRQVELFRGDTWLVAASDHELARRAVVETAALAGQTILLPEGYCGYPMDLKQRLEQAQIEAETVMEFGSIESIKQCVKSGLGISLLPAIAVREELARGELVSLPWSGPPIPIEAYMLFHRDKWLSPAAAALEDVIAAVGGQSGDTGTGDR